LTAKGHFPTAQAVILVEAMDMTIGDAQLVTVSVLDARFAAFEAKWETRFVVFEARMEQKFDRLRLQLIIAIILSNLTMGPLGTAALEALRRAF
jgi:hypothetical protein